MPNNVGYYRKELERHQTTARQIILDEIEGEVKRLLEYIDSVDTDCWGDLEEGMEYIKASLKELSEKLY